MIEIIYRVRFPGDFGFGCKSSKFHQVFVHQTDGKYEVVEGVYDSYCDRFEQPYTDYDFNTAHQFDSALEADDYARKLFFELQKEARHERTWQDRDCVSNCLMLHCEWRG